MKSVRVPDIGDFKDVPLIEVLVVVGDRIDRDQPIAVLETDKATMEIPSPSAGVVETLVVKPGDRVSQGTLILTLRSDETEAAANADPSDVVVAHASQIAEVYVEEAAPESSAPVKGPEPLVVSVPNIGDFKNVPVIGVLVNVGEHIKKDQPLVVVESDKATMEIPSPVAGTIQSLDVKIGDKVNVGVALLVLLPDERQVAKPSAHPAPTVPVPAAVAVSTPAAMPAPAPLLANASPAAESGAPTYAGPAVRKLARQLGVELAQVKGSGPRGRIVVDDVHAHVKAALQTPRATVSSASGAGLPFELPPWPKPDHAKFGPIETQPLSRIRRISGPSLHRNWVSIPHVTNHDDADITELEAFRLHFNRDNEKQGVKLSPLAFVLKACVNALQAFPEINASLDGDNIILKHYFHIGFAADTSQGLVVPVIRDADKKGVVQIAQEMGELAAKARGGKLSPTDMQGGTFSISSLGGIGGSYFTPIINAPEVAILGLGKTQTRVCWIDGQAQPRLYLPISLSWDHRVIDGAVAGRFNAHLVKALADLRRLLL